MSVIPTPVVSTQDINTGWFTGTAHGTHHRRPWSGTDKCALWCGDHAACSAVLRHHDPASSRSASPRLAVSGPIVILTPHLQITGDVDYSFTVPDIPIPAIHTGITASSLPAHRPEPPCCRPEE